MLAPSSSRTRACPAVLTVRPGPRFAGDAPGCLSSRGDPVVAPDLVAPGHDCAVRAPRPHLHTDTHVYCPRALRRRRHGLARRKFAAPPPTRGRRCDGWLLAGARGAGAGVARKAGGGLRRKGGADPQADAASSTDSLGGGGYAPGRLRATPRQPGRCPCGHDESRQVTAVGRLRTDGTVCAVEPARTVCAVDPVRTADAHDTPRAAPARASTGRAPLRERSEGNGEDRIPQEVGPFRGA